MYKAGKIAGEMKNEKRDDGEGGYSLNDDRRVKVLSPGALVMKRFLRNSLAVTGMIVLLVMFLFSFLGGLISPYEEDEIFFTTEIQNKVYAGAKEFDELVALSPEDKSFSGTIVVDATLAVYSGKRDFISGNKKYTVVDEGNDAYSIQLNGQTVGMFAIDNVFASSKEYEKTLNFEFKSKAIKAYANGATSFIVSEAEYTLDEDGYIKRDGVEIAYITRYVVNAVASDVFLTRDFKDALIERLESGEKEFDFSFKQNDGMVENYTVKYDAEHSEFVIRRAEETVVADTYASPSSKHWLGTDGYGMDMLTRLMYGGRVSLMIGFIVVIIETVLGVILGGIAGYFGKWVDNLIMRIVDIFYCIPSTPILIMLGAMMDDIKVQPKLRMIYLMLILGFLGWPGIARMVRGQILSLREQEFMTATEACGVRVSRRIFKHLIPNVIPQLIVICTMGLGSTIITEATLSFLGLGVRFPFASWGNIINAADTVHILTNYWFAWIPAGMLLLLTVLAFNLVGDGLRDAFDPKMKR